MCWSTFAHLVLQLPGRGCHTRNTHVALGQPCHRPSLLRVLGCLCLWGSSIRRRDRAPTGLEPQPAQRDQGNWSGPGKLTRTVVVLVYLLPLPLPPLTWGKGGSSYARNHTISRVLAGCQTRLQVPSWVITASSRPCLLFWSHFLPLTPLPSASTMRAVFLGLPHTEVAPVYLCAAAASWTALPLSFVRLLW